MAEGIKDREAARTGLPASNGSANGQHVPDDRDEDAVETQEWLDSLEAVLQIGGKERATFLLSHLHEKTEQAGADVPFNANTPYVNTIHADEQPEFPGNREIERKIKSLVRWNAMAMVLAANEKTASGGAVGGHIGTFASSANLYEVGFNHFFRGPDAPGGGDLIFFQGHASPGMYARAFLEGRLSEQHLKNFRQELQPGGGLSSYPHPWLMPDFWQFPTVSMGLGPIGAIYQARFNRYLEHRGLKPASPEQKVWAFLGDGEMDEPESMGAITLASREKLDNLIFVVNCNLQRLDGPVRGNGKIVQELEAAFRGAGWNCVKCLWGSEWDPLLAADTNGLLRQRMMEVVDGEYQKYVVAGGAYTREHFFGKHPELLELVKHLSDEQIAKLKRGGHDPVKVYAAYKAAVETKGKPTVVLVATVKGYGLGDSGEGKNTIHNTKTFTDRKQVLTHVRDRFELGISDKHIEECLTYKLPVDSPEMKYLHERRKKLGGYLPQRRANAPALEPPPKEFVDYYAKGDEKPASTTMVFVRQLDNLLSIKTGLGKHIVPIIPDEARTFGMDSFFAKYEVYSSIGQRYVPVDDEFAATAYREAKNGQMLEEGITEAGAMASFIAAGTAYATHGVPTVPFYTYYSMFGFQRIGDQAWLAADARCRGFMMGATAGRTTLNGEGLQHQDGHSHVQASTIPNLMCYDPTYGYEMAVIIRDGIRRMFGPKPEDIFYYLTIGNDNYPMAAMPAGSEEGILRGLYKFKASAIAAKKGKAHLFGSGAILPHVVKAQGILAEQFGIAADVWSATSYKELRRDGLEVERWNFLHPAEKPRQCYVEKVLGAEGKNDVF
ncbi:MAG: pyruvate dehydrogenase (acetyl-transferring), homodimeric type, partial [Gemmataceae bacterium]|nr:pyruvate dehydrogenase (acetyl-transferring), homodimeric type [Gemmataceae bacterium]